MKKNFRKSSLFSIQTKLLFYLLLISIVPLVVMGVFSVVVSINPLKQVAINPAYNHVLSLAGHIRQELFNVREDVLYSSRLPDLSRMLEYYDESTPEDQITLIQDVVNDFQELITKRKKYHYISYIDEDGFERVRLNYFSPQKWKIVVGDELQRKNEAPFFQKTLDLAFGETYISPVTLNVEHGVLESPLTKVIYVTTPVEDITRNKKGLIVIALKAEVLFKPVHKWRVQEYPTATTFIVNDAGFYLAHSDTSKEWGERQKGMQMKWSLINDYPAVVSEALLHNDKQTIIEPHDLSRIFVKAPFLPEFAEAASRWIIVCDVSQEMMYSTINRFKKIIITILLATIIATLALAVIIARQFTRPIKVLRNGAAIIQQGDLSHRIPIRSSDEIGELTFDFNQMTEQLEELYSNLEQKVKDRTERLQKALEDLRIKDKQIRESDRIKLDFLTNLSSELRTPLASVTNYIALLLGNVYGEITDKQKEALTKMQKNLYHTFKWLDGIIRISSLSAFQPEGINSIRIRSFDLIKSIIAAHNKLNYAFEEQAVSLTYNFPANRSLMVTSDQEKIDEILSSVFNAVIHYPASKQSTVQIGLKERKEEQYTGHEIIITVTFAQETEQIDINDFYRALNEPFIHSHSYFNITNLSTNVARGLLSLIHGALVVEHDSDTKNISLCIYFKEGEAS